MDIYLTILFIFVFIIAILRLEIARLLIASIQ
jgi:hypothetical protein